MNKIWSLLRMISLITSCITASIVSRAQNLHSISAASNQAEVSGVQFDYSIGELAIIHTYTIEKGTMSLTQGFLQPYIPLLNFRTIRPTLLANNILTPNGDGKNDYLVFPDLEKYSKNSLKIFDRGGRLLYTTRDYKNDWNAFIKNTALQEDTYYYLFEAFDGNEFIKIKGFFTVLHDQY